MRIDFSLVLIERWYLSYWGDVRTGDHVMHFLALGPDLMDKWCSVLGFG